MTSRRSGSSAAPIPGAIGPEVATRAAGAILTRPGLWPTAARQLAALAPRGWWWRPPYLPLPDPAYLAFRLQTMYGEPDHSPPAADVVTYLLWCRRYRRLAR